MRMILLVITIGALTACRIGDNVPDTGESCADSSECEGPLSCVPIDADNNAGARVCMPPPDGFDDNRCDAFFIGDADAICDCGCGVVDVDCADDTAASCDPEKGDHCPDGKTIVADDNAKCE